MNEAREAGSHTGGRPSFIIAVSGPSGAGKTSLIHKTAELLTSATRLHFDDYVTLGNDIAQIRAWIDAGADPNEVKTPALAVDLRSLAARESIRPPNASESIEPADFVILEEPFGRARLELAPIIDLAAHIEVPPDIALARRIVREIASQQSATAQLVADIDIQLRAFLAVGREAYLAAARVARETADIVLDGMQPVDDLAATLVAEIRRRA